MLWNDWQCFRKLYNQWEHRGTVDDVRWGQETLVERARESSPHLQGSVSCCQKICTALIEAKTSFKSGFLAISNRPRLQKAGSASPNTDQLVSQSTQNPIGDSFNAKVCLPCAKLQLQQPFIMVDCAMWAHWGLQVKTAVRETFNFSLNSHFIHHLHLQIISNQKKWLGKLEWYA